MKEKGKGEFRIKRIISIFLSLLMMLNLLSVTAMAANPDQRETTVTLDLCSVTVVCENGTATVNGADYAAPKLVVKGSEITIVCTPRANFPTGEEEPTVTVNGQSTSIPMVTVHPTKTSTQTTTAIPTSISIPMVTAMPISILTPTAMSMPM